MKLDPMTKKFTALDACHQQIQQHLDLFNQLQSLLEADSDSPACRQQAGAIESFFSGTSRQHHADEEKNVFPALLASDNAELVQAVLTLKQDHGWIEQNWLELAPMLRAIAQGEDWPDLAELQHYIAIFLTLCQDHIALEESLIYPAAKEHFALEMAKRAAFKES
jgi:hemerythrin-like domain-containing protein